MIKRFHGTLAAFLGTALLLMTAQGMAQSALKTVRFTFQPVIGGVEKVFLAGTFNDWDDTRDEMKDTDGDGIYETTLLLAPGRYEYKFVVDGKYITDPNAEEISGSGRSGDNAIINVDERFDAVAFMPGDDQILTRDLPYALNQVMVNAEENRDLTFTALAFYPDIESMTLHYLMDGAAHDVPMIVQDHDAVYCYYTVVLPDAAEKDIDFYFELADGVMKKYKTVSGHLDTMPAACDFYHYDIKTLPPFRAPAWVRNGIFYQIFPDRFRNGNPGNDQDFSERYYNGKTELPESGKTDGEYFHLVKDWGNIAGLVKSPYRDDGKPDYYSFYGGDIAGVTSRLDYLKDLGITIIYFNPVNEGKSNHKYDPVDYLSIDPHFGTEAEFKELVSEAHDRGIRIIVDMAFNHTGDEHYAFVDSRAKGPDSEYWSWYEWNQWPIPDGEPPTPCYYYACWWDFPLHPNLNFDLSRPNDQENMIRDVNDAEPNKAVVNHVLSVADYWIGELGIDGFRLDVPNEVPFWFWEKFRRRVDELNPEAFLIAELWGDALPWLGPKYFHSTMNYKYFREPVIQFFALGAIDAKTFDMALTPGRYLYPTEAAQAMMNLIGSHDTKRFLAQADEDVRKLRLAVLFQMTYGGVPAIYYGDEVALTGGKDPDNRRTFPWDWAESVERQATHKHYQQLTALRNGNSALRTGQFKTLFAEQGQYVYARYDDVGCFAVAINNSASKVELTVDLTKVPGVQENDQFFNVQNRKVLQGTKGMFKLTLAPYEGLVIQKKQAGR